MRRHEIRILLAVLLTALLIAGITTLTELIKMGKAH